MPVGREAGRQAEKTLIPIIAVSLSAITSRNPAHMCGIQL